MSEKEALEQLAIVNAEDISEGMQTGTFDFDASGEQNIEQSKSTCKMWSVKIPAASVETTFAGGILTEINYWDWSNRKMTSYHHTMEYIQVSSITIRQQPKNGIDSEIIKTHNADGG